ncbi:hypothetical protein KC930_00265 [Candidatus Saccharibacteria bacterium]|nr:hypothetical protein [Candidatus Saccharibacteria bacterium]
MAKKPVVPPPSLQEAYLAARAELCYSDQGPLIDEVELYQLLSYPGQRVPSNAYVGELLKDLFGEYSDTNSRVEDFLANGFSWQVRENGGPTAHLMIPQNTEPFYIMVALSPVVVDMLANMIMIHTSPASDKDVPGAVWEATRWYYETCMIWAGLSYLRLKGFGVTQDVSEGLARYNRSSKFLESAKIGPIAFADLCLAADLSTKSAIDRMTRRGSGYHGDGVFNELIERLSHFAEKGLHATNDPFFAALSEVDTSALLDTPESVVQIFG